MQSNHFTSLFALSNAIERKLIEHRRNICGLKAKSSQVDRPFCALRTSGRNLPATFPPYGVSEIQQ